MIAVLFIELFIRFCRFGSDVLSDDAFHVIMFVSCSVSVLALLVGVGMGGGGGGCEYSCMFSRHRSASMINWFGRKGNLFWRVVGVGIVSWLWMYSCISAYIEFFVSIISWLFSTNVV